MLSLLRGVDQRVLGPVTMALLILVVLVVGPIAGAQDFSLANGYFSLSGDDGKITSLRFDQSGSGSYDANTIRSGGHFAFTLDSTLMESGSATYSYNGTTTVTISNLPLSASLVIGLNGNTLTSKVTFTGTRALAHAWTMDYRDAGWYQRTLGRNYPTSGSLAGYTAVDAPFESFFGMDSPNGFPYWPVEAFKGRSGTTVNLWYNNKVLCRARASRDDSVEISSSWPLYSYAGSQLVNARFKPASTSLDLEYSTTTLAGSQFVKLKVVPKSYSVTLDDKPLPEFYTQPAYGVAALSDGNVAHGVGDLLTELFQHSTYWFGPTGLMWADWCMRSGCFMNNAYTDALKQSLMGWIVGYDGYGHNGYAYTMSDSTEWIIPPSTDSRFFNTNSILITSLWRYFIWSRDVEYLKSGTSDLYVKINFDDSTNLETMPVSAYRDAFRMVPQTLSLGQLIYAKKAFSSVTTRHPAYGTTGAGAKMTLWTVGGSKVAESTYTGVSDANGVRTLSFSSQAAGYYYLEMTDPSGAIGWWGIANRGYEDAYLAGDARRGGYSIESMYNRAQTAMAYQQNTLLGGQENLLVLGNNIGTMEHYGGDGNVGSHWYDILPFGYRDLLLNVNFYESLKGLADIEEAMGNSSQASAYRSQATTVTTNMTTHLWRTISDNGTNRKRYIGTRDAWNADHDYGYTGLNLMAIVAGIPDSTKTSDIFSWLDNGASQHGASTWVSDIYSRWVFAPRVSTKYNPDWWGWEWSATEYPWDTQLQNGGASLHESGFDVIARATKNSANNGWQRLYAILGRYADPDRLSQKGTGWYGEKVQGDNVAGAVGWMHGEFPETTVLGSAWLYGFVGASADMSGLHLIPHVPTPSGVTAVGAKNITYNEARFDLLCSTTNTTINCTSNPYNRSFVINGTTYSGTFNVTVALDGNGHRLIEPVADSTAPSAPSGLSITSSNSVQTVLDWSNNSEADLAAYNVYRSTSSGFTPGSGNIIAKGVTQSAYTDLDLPVSFTNLYYKVIAVDRRLNESSASSQVSR